VEPGTLNFKRYGVAGRSKSNLRQVCVGDWPCGSMVAASVPNGTDLLPIGR
jgi:hypothetical protein